jgi:hypothetical protein
LIVPTEKELLDLFADDCAEALRRVIQRFDELTAEHGRSYAEERFAHLLDHWLNHKLWSDETHAIMPLRDLYEHIGFYLASLFLDVRDEIRMGERAVGVNPDADKDIPE